MNNSKKWRCNVCGAIVVGIDWQQTLKGQTFHTTPTGGECRIVNFDRVFDFDADPRETESLEKPKSSPD